VGTKKKHGLTVGEMQSGKLIRNVGDLLETLAASSRL
jgi:hypothetical protein